jgi:hypothetical protein
MRKIIKKNKRRPFPYIQFPVPVIIKRNRSFSIVKEFKFTNTAIYQFNDEDQYDVNKLFGFSLGFHHINSVRFGWRPSEDLTKMEIVGYEYLNKLRIPTVPIYEVELNKWYKYELKYNGVYNHIEYNISDSINDFCTIHPITLKHKWNIGYKLYLYFGGNKKAPHDILIYQS